MPALCICLSPVAPDLALNGAGGIPDNAITDESGNAITDESGNVITDET